MRLYGRRFARSAIEKKTRAVQETRDAILWDVQAENKTCRVKIQGSDEFIVAHYPRNWKSIPYWLKRGNAVRILHRGGNRGFVEVIGEGRAIPTPVSGSTFPDEETLPDAIVSGCTLQAIDPASMNLITIGGTYRIDGQIYVFSPDSADYVLMQDPAIMTMGDNIVMGSAGWNVTLDAAPSVGSFRYDAFCGGADRVIDYIKGSASSTPEKPLITADHVLIGKYILVVGGATVIESKDIGRLWSIPYAATLEIDIESSGASYDMPYVPGSPAPATVTASIAISIKDQFGNAYSESCSAVITKNTGGGTLDPSSVTFSSSTTATWERDQTSDNIPMVFTVEGTIDSKTLTAIGIINPEAAP